MKIAILRTTTLFALALTIMHFARAETTSVAQFDVLGYSVEVHSGDLGDFRIATETRIVADGTAIATLRLQSDKPGRPPKLSLKWAFPSHDIAGIWSPADSARSLGPDWYPTSVESMFARHAPVFQLFGWADQNRVTFAVSDALNTVRLAAGVREEDGLVHATINLFEQLSEDRSSYELQLRVDRRPVPFYTALKDVADWWASLPGMAPAEVPPIAREPMYSTWYSYHQNVTPEPLLREIKVGRSFGLKAIIIDDGWQTDDNRRGYAYTGDWEAVKIPDMREFVDAAHAADTKVLLWYSVPLVGEKSNAYAKFRGKYLRYWNGQGAYELDPRYPDVRQHIIDTYVTAMRDWGVDGFKLDFIGRFVANDETELVAANGRDYASVNEAADRLFTDTMTELRRVNPQVMIEFRQPYIGPLMRKYGNMFRAGDTPNAALGNRRRTIDLRMLSGGTAVHADMIMWHYDEAVETAALQYLNVLFSVPQISVRLNDIPADHRQMVSFYTEYWRRNRDLLLDGDLEALAPLANYPQVSAVNASKRIIALYDDRIVQLDADDLMLEAIDIVNAKASTEVVLNVGGLGARYRLNVLDATGNAVVEQELHLQSGLHAIEVPPSGLAAFELLSNL